ncbi:hypothetical protein O1611_g6102 [Lasiodiplodia mahajangana]|uniref:Uncharacterized protein n=1 Tax=Lasiodiplodia mahajangana TaxID=1108764 RepID=A0ACC2JJ39_9PEZI|nr:hypothetical protein O1611_g6102 [Lasiodiplodia mahajangana]
MAPSTKFTHRSIIPEPDDVYRRGTKIRLLHVLPGYALIKCKIFRISLHKKPDYETLSYCWGTLDRKEEILINNKSFPITRNLYDALERLRFTDKPRTLWIDAICINQDSLDEKKFFVPLMKEIYQSSRRTIIWLGEHNSLTEGALEILEFMASKYDELRRGFLSSAYWKKAKRGQKNQKSTWLTELRDQHDKYNAIRALDSLFRRPWFERTWTIQELVVGTDPLVVCGRFHIKWETIFRAWFVSDDDLCQPENIRFLSDLRKTWEERGDSGLLFEIMLKSWHHGVTDEKDKIYGLLGLVSLNHILEVPVEIDYEADTGQVFTQFTRGCISTTKKLDILSMCSGFRNSRWPGVPSWALHCRPDPATEPHPDISLACSAEGRRRSFNAGTWPLKTFEFSIDGKALGLVALELDIITGVSAVFPRVGLTESIDSIFGDFKINLMEDIAFISAYLDAKRLWNVDANQIYSPTGQPIREAFRLTLFTLQYNYHVAWDEEEERNSLADFEFFEHLSSKVGEWKNSKKMVWPRSPKLLIPEYLNPNSRLEDFYGRAEFVWHKRGILSHSGYIGIGPRETQVGDKIVLIQGSRVPMVVRQVLESYRIVGECYVHGIMNGEAFDESKATMMWFD